MEIKNTTASSTGDLLCTINGDFRQESRSYTCTFCKRDFSNAQALGGHMNVHRKDRAKLQESIQETLITNEPAKGTTNSINQREEQSSSSDGVPKRPLTFREENSHRRKNDDHGVNFKKPTLQLSLCIESSSSSIISDSSITRSNKVYALSSSSSTEVDLELRLGMDSEARSRDHVI